MAAKIDTDGLQAPETIQEVTPTPETTQEPVDYKKIAEEKEAELLRVTEELEKVKKLDSSEEYKNALLKKEAELEEARVKEQELQELINKSQDEKTKKALEEKLRREKDAKYEKEIENFKQLLSLKDKDIEESKKLLEQRKKEVEKANFEKLIATRIVNEPYLAPHLSKMSSFADLEAFEKIIDINELKNAYEIKMKSGLSAIADVNKNTGSSNNNSQKSKLELYRENNYNKRRR